AVSPHVRSHTRRHSPAPPLQPPLLRSPPLSRTLAPPHPAQRPHPFPLSARRTAAASLPALHPPRSAPPTPLLCPETPSHPTPTPAVSSPSSAAALSSSVTLTFLPLQRKGWEGKGRGGPRSSGATQRHRHRCAVVYLVLEPAVPLLTMASPPLSLYLPHGGAVQPAAMAFWQARHFLFCSVCGTLLDFNSQASLCVVSENPVANARHAPCFLKINEWFQANN
uniref:Uncharacterized protein n=1 Tax=Triticum urartu TaxID=4572 RepID=A0A8R7PQL1_TRIUA